MLTLSDKKYIDTSITTAIKASEKRMDARMDHYFDTHIKHHIALQNEFIRDQIALVIEVVKDKPSREEVRDIARDELRYHGLER